MSSSITTGARSARGRSRKLDGAPIAQADLTEAEVDRLFAEAQAALGVVDICIAVAGAWPREDLPCGSPQER